MEEEIFRLDSSVIIPVLEPLREINHRLLDLLKSFTADDWSQPTAHSDRDVKDLTAHLLHGSLRRVTSMRDSYRRPTPAIASTDDLIAFIQADNRDFMQGMRRISPQILIELISIYDRELVALFSALNPHEDGLGVAWAGERVSRNWFDLAREYTEKWHHQQQLRDATGREPLYEANLFTPVLETFARGLPFALRNVDLPDKSRISVEITGAITPCWTIYWDAGTRSLWQGKHPDAIASISIPADVAWRLWTKSIHREEAIRQIQSAGDRSVVDAIADFVAIMA